MIDKLKQQVNFLLMFSLKVASVKTSEELWKLLARLIASSFKYYSVEIYEYDETNKVARIKAHQIKFHNAGEAFYEI